MRKRALRRAVLTAATLALAFSAVAYAGTNSRPAQAVPAPAAVNSAPVVTVPADFEWEADTLGGWQSWFTATAIDAEDGLLPVTCTPAPGTFLPLGTTNVSCSATDSAGLAGSASFAIAVTDTTAPMLTSVPPMLWVETPDLAGAVVGWPEPWAVDIVDGLVTVTCLPASGSTFALGATPVTCSAADLSGNVATDSFMLYLTLVDSTPPVLSDVPGDMVVDTTDPWGITVTWPLPTATDNIDGPLPVVCAPASGSFFYGGPTTVTCTATDTRANTGSASFTVTVNVAPIVDTTPPVLGDVPTGIAVDTYDAGGAIVTWPDPWALDDIDGPLPVICTPASGSLFEVGATIVECSATDSSGNDGTATPFTVQVTLVDIIPPAISGVPANMVVPAAGPGGTAVSWTTVTAMDNIDGVVPVTCDPASGSHFPVGEAQVTCVASDASGNVASARFLVEVTFVDTTPPVMSGVPTGISANTTHPSGATVSWTAPTALDAIDGPVGVTCTPASGSHFAVGATTVSCSAADRAGNVATAARFTVRVVLVDNTAPVISGIPADIGLATTDPTGAVATWTAPSAVDNIDGAVPVVCAPVAGSRFPVGRTTVRCTAADAAGNAATRTFDVRVTLTVLDTTPPTLSGLPGDISVQTSPTARMAVTWTLPTAVDDVDGPVPVTCNPASGTSFAVGSTGVTCSASDRAGNVARGSFSVVVTAAAPDPTPTPGPAAGLEVTWGKPIRESAMYKVRIGKKVELKAHIAIDGVALRKKTGTPRLVVERLSACGGAVLERRDGGALKGKGRDWKIDLKTSTLGTGCWRISVAYDGAEGGAFELMVLDKDTRKKDDRKRDERKSDESDLGDLVSDERAE